MNLLKDNIQYIVEMYPHGFLVCSAPMKAGVPLTAMNEVMKLAPKGAVMCPGVANALGGVFAVGKPKEMREWREEIAAKLEAQPISKDLKWIRGVDTGMSSRALFIRLTQSTQAKAEAIDHRRGSSNAETPADSDDLGRCVRLIEYMGWQDRVKDAADISPKWSKIIADWDNLMDLYKKNKDAEIYKILKAINEVS